MKPELIVDAPILNTKKIWVKKIDKPHFDHPFHFHGCCELVWVEKSYGKLIIGDYVGSFTESELVLAGPGLPHLWRCDPTFYSGRKEMRTKAVGIYFPPELILSITDNSAVIALYKRLLTRMQRGMRISGKDKRTVIEKIKAICKAGELEKLGYFLQAMDTLMLTSDFELLASIGYKKVQNENDINQFNMVYRFLLKNFHRNIRLNEVASICGMTPNSFCRFFKTKTQKTFSRFMNELRIGHACKMLHMTNNPIVTVAYESGYNNPVNFFKFFKLITGQTPREYRNYMKNLDPE